MANIRPFAPLVYSSTSQGKLSKLICPPYDVISESFYANLLARDPHNAVRLILGLHGENRYESAASTLQSWIKSETLTQEKNPTVFILQDRFTWLNKTYERNGILCLTQLEEPGKGSIFAHERTLDKPLDDRMQMLKATRTHLSPVFLIHEDQDQQIIRWIKNQQALVQSNSFHNEDEPIEHRIWEIAQLDALKTLIDLYASENLLIADGHHRYKTAREFSRTHGAKLPEANWMLSYIAPASQPGLLLSAIHRVIQNVGEIEHARKEASKYFAFRELGVKKADFADASEPLAWVEQGKLFALQPLSGALKQIAPSQRDVPSSILNELILHRIFHIDVSQPEDQSRLTFFKNPEDVIQNTMSQSSVGFLLKPLDVKEVIRISMANELLPQKSTYFYPKVMTGFAFHSL